MKMGTYRGIYFCSLGLCNFQALELSLIIFVCNNMLLTHAFMCHQHFRFLQFLTYTHFSWMKTENIKEMQEDINMYGKYLITLLASGPVASF